jgi:hypothetical protein
MVLRANQEAANLSTYHSFASLNSSRYARSSFNSIIIYMPRERYSGGHIKQIDEAKISVTAQSPKQKKPQTVQGADSAPKQRKPRSK